MESKGCERIDDMDIKSSKLVSNDTGNSRKMIGKTVAAAKDDVPSSEVVALRNGYNQTYIISSSTNHLHDVLFRCGNWCYTGKVDLSSSEITLSELPVVIPALQKQQGSLQYLCEWRGISSSSPYAAPLETLYDMFDFIGTELSSAAIEKKLIRAMSEFPWIDEENSVKNFFELTTGGYSCFDNIDLVASKTFIRELVLIVVYYKSSFYILLQEGSGDQPLLDIRFPDLSAHLQGVHLVTYNSDECKNMKKLCLWQAIKQAKNVSPPKPIQVKCRDVSGKGYNQTFLIRKIQSSGTGNQISGLREVLFRFGNWCYNGHIDLGSTINLQDIPIIIPMLRRQQSALTFMCEASKMPATSLFTPSMEYLAEILPAIQQELSNSEAYIHAMTQNEPKTSRISKWLQDNSYQCFFELQMDKNACLQDVEAIACKVYLGGVVLVIIFYDSTFFIHLDNAEDEQPLLDTSFPDITSRTEGVQLKLYRDGIRDCPALRRMSLWHVQIDDSNDDDSQSEDEHCARVSADNSHSALNSEAKYSQRRAEENTDIQTGRQLKNLPNDNVNGVYVAKRMNPHHIAPLTTSSKLSTLSRFDSMDESLMKMTDAKGMVAPWDATGKPLGLRTSK